MKYNLIRALRRAVSNLRDRVTESYRRFGKQTDEVFSDEPIDFSSPSIPYYEDLSNRFGFVRVVLYMALFVFILVTVICNHRLITYKNLYYLAKDIGAATLTSQSEADRLSYPISSGEADFAAYRGGLIIAGSEVVTAMSASGRHTLSVNVDYASPEVRSSDKYFLTFGRGETSFAVYNAFVQVHRQSTDFPVYDAVVADNGTFAILTRSRDYRSEVILYDEDMEPLANRHYARGYVTGLAVNASGSCVGIVSVEARSGVWETTVTLIRIGNRITEESVTFTGTVGSTCSFTTDERLAVLFSDRLLLLSSDATITREVEFGIDEPVLCTISSNRIAVITRRSSDLSAEYLTAYDHNGNRIYEILMDESHPIRLSGGADSLTFGGDILYIRAAGTLYRLSSDGKTMTSAAVSRDTITVLSYDTDHILVCTPAYAARMESDDFS